MTSSENPARLHLILARLQSTPSRVLIALTATAALSVIVVFGYAEFVAGEMNQFARFSLEKRITLPVMYCAFALAVVWPSRATGIAERPRLPLWWWLLLVAVGASSALSAIYSPRPVEPVDYFQGLALFGGGLILALAGILATGWDQKYQFRLLLLLVIIGSISLVGATLTPFRSVIVPSTAAAMLLALRLRRYRLPFLVLAAVLGTGLVLRTWGGGPELSVAFLAEIGATGALLLVLGVPQSLRRSALIAVVVLGTCFVAVSDYVSMLLGESDYLDITLAQRGFEASAAAEQVFASPWTSLLGLGPGGTVDLTSSPDATTLEASGRVLSAVESVHLLHSHVLLKLGLLGVVALLTLVWAIARQVLLAVQRRDDDVFGDVLLFYVLAGLAQAIPAATNLYTNPLPLLFLGMLWKRNLNYRVTRGNFGGGWQGATSFGAFVATSKETLFRRLRGAGVVLAVSIAAVSLATVADRKLDLFPVERGVKAPFVIFLGDSYAAGVGATEESLSFPALIGQAEGWQVENRARGGTGYVSALGGTEAWAACGREYCKSFTHMIGEVAIYVDAVVVSGGRFDWYGGTDEWAAGVDAFYADLRDRVPNALIIAISPLWDDEPGPGRLVGMGDVVRRAVTAVGGVYVDVGQPLLGRPDLVASDSVHPNDAGHRAIADAFEASYHGSS